MNWWGIWSSVCVAVGAGSGVWSVHADKLYWRN